MSGGGGELNIELDARRFLGRSNHPHDCESDEDPEKPTLSSKEV